MSLPTLLSNLQFTLLLNRLAGVEGQLRRALLLLESLTMAAPEMLATLQRIDAAATNLAGDLARLRDLITTQMSPEDVARVQAALDAAAVRLEGLAAETPEPPVAPPA